ncbi:MAG: bifunctional DNA primase/polymerase [Candidatus Nealsonbacteria bacterium]|nr:bifunctional DNA primase/polymerase [Candidatus Nealsonbacteria bacterium]
MYNSVNACISAGTKYVEALDWWLVPVHGIGKKAKSPIYKGWPDVKPGIDHLQACLDFHGDAGIGINLGGSGLLDLEGDSEEGEAILTDLCIGIDFPRYKSSKSIHRLFQVPDSVGHLGNRSRPGGDFWRN